MHEIFGHFQARLPAAVLALVLTACAGLLAGPLKGNANPLLWGVMDGLLGGWGGRLDRAGRPSRDLVVRGFFLTLPGLVFAGGFGAAAQHAQALIPRNAGDVLFLAPALAGGAVWRALLRLHKALKKSGRPGQGAYFAIARSARTDLSGADDFTITRAGMALAARAFDKGVVAPVFWYVVAGLPGAYLYAGIAALAWRFGRDGFTQGFGAPALALEKIAGFLPSLLAGVLMALAGLFTPTGGMTRAFAGILGGKGKAPYAEGGLPVTAMAFALNVALGGPVQDLDGRSLKRVWAGPENATARLEPGHLRRALYIALMAYLLLIIVLAAGMAG